MALDDVGLQGSCGRSDLAWILSRLCHQPTGEGAGRKQLPPLVCIQAGKATGLLAFISTAGLRRQRVHGRGLRGAAGSLPWFITNSVKRSQSQSRTLVTGFLM